MKENGIIGRKCWIYITYLITFTLSTDKIPRYLFTNLPTNLSLARIFAYLSSIKIIGTPRRSNILFRKIIRFLITRWRFHFLFLLPRQTILDSRSKEFLFSNESYRQSNHSREEISRLEMFKGRAKGREKGKSVGEELSTREREP